MPLSAHAHGIPYAAQVASSCQEELQHIFGAMPDAHDGLEPQKIGSPLDRMQSAERLVQQFLMFRLRSFS